MKVWTTICCVALTTFSGVAAAGGGWHGGGWHGGSGWHGGVWIGAPIVIGAPYYYPPYYPYPYYRYGPPVREYVYEQPAPAPVSPPAPTWYYCRESQAYYPYVQECPGGWDSVPAKPPAGGRP